MRYAVEISEQAEADMRSIFRYIAYELQAIQSACNWLDRLEESIYSLEHMPDRCRLYDREPWRTRGVRVMVVGKYCVFYLPDHESGVVSILRVIYGGRDMESALNG